ncbi:uncharacterized protein wu:fj29h11 isoform X2 [Solea solea]|uniref:uncharacterized protein wu:fj29h11 isoform X2 n=1 Tax=Solea solea TaxID=90069 RepID=UPI00272C5688|nr:uncharacterized protein wu:fj29h11 isoform X2 [Solea solea]
MEELKNVVALVKDHPDGIPLSKLAVFYNQTYHQNLTLSDLGFTSMAELVASLKRDLIVEKKVVFHKSHFYKMKRAEFKCVENKKPEDALANVVSMVKQHPAGIPIKRLTTSYSQTYHNNLTLSLLGFDSITSLVASLDSDLVVREEVVFHRSHQPQNPPGGLKTATSKDGSRSSTPDRHQSRVAELTFTSTVKMPRVSLPPLTQAGSKHLSAPGARPEPADQLQLHQRISEVKEKYHLNNPSLEQLQLFYFRHFGEAISLAECKSLQDSMEACGPKNVPAQAKPGAANGTDVSLTPAAHNLTREPQPVLTPKMLSESEFPELGTSKNVTRKQKKEERDTTQRGDTGPVSRDAYHAQLRRVHGDNMRAVEATERLPRRGRNGVMDAGAVNSLMEDVRRQIAAEGDLVTEEQMIYRTCKLMQVSSLEALGLDRKEIPAVKDLKYIRKEITMFIKSTKAVSCMCTLYELSQSLAGLKDKRSFEELHLGPLCKIPDIYHMFRIDSTTKDDDLHQIETVDILKHLRMFKRKEKKEKVDLVEFLQHLTDHYNCEYPYELGIWMSGIGLPLATLRKVFFREQELMAQAQDIILRELEEETQDQLRKVKRKVLESLQGPGSFSSQGNCDLRKQYAQMTAAEVVMQVFTNAEGLFTLRMKKQVQQFLMCVSSDRLARVLFQLAICGGSLAVPHDLVPKDKSHRTNEQAKTEDKVSTSLPSAATLKEFLKTSLLSYNSAVTLGHISTLEKKLSRHFRVKDFPCLQQGSFLEFLVQHIQLLQDTLGSTLFVGSGGMDPTGSGFRPTKQDVFEFIKQCGNITSTDPDEIYLIESALRSHYRVPDCRDLGFGSLQTLVGLVQRQSQLTGGGQSQVFYESALFAKHGKLSAEGGSEAVGLLGEMTTAKALNSLLSCPLLEDLSEWSQWELIFKPLHGSLKDFIERNAANTGLAALEVKPGSLLRITTHTGDKQFSSATMNLDPVGTAGHLVSMAVADGIDSVPAALLANYMQSSLELAVAKEEFPQAEDETSCYSRVANFVLVCLTRIPIRICQTFLQQVFLVPFARALGQTKSKQVLVTVARSDTSHMNCLHRLGIVVGITEWEKDFREKLNPPPAAPVEQIKFNLYNSASSRVSALNSSEDENLEENIMDSSFASSLLNETQHQVNGKEDVEVEEEEDEEELFEFAPLPNGDSSHITSEAEEGEEEEELSEMSDSDEKDSVTSCQSETTSTPQRAIIEDIRKSEFGIGEKMTAKSHMLMQKNQERLGRSLERLSTELYSKDTHFVLELIQNADDNSYPLDAGVGPSLAFIVEKDCITVLNNEIGFQENHIRAICDVGRSTKGKHKYGYIGQKGIGFKSVFKVTDCPEIHSNGFHLRFDRMRDHALGYILPHWTEDERPLDAQMENISQNSWTTKICLPLRTESHQTKNLFHDVHPSLLLFLHRLRSITICNQSEKRLVTMTRKDLSHDVVEVEHTEGVEQWLVVKTTLQPKHLKEDVLSTELALAFQLCSDDTETNMVAQPQKQPVYAYLPLRSFGFRFIIQGDFDIPSSREDVDRDSSWNQWLRTEIPQLFLQAMDVFTTHPKFSGLKGLCHFLQFVPLPDEVLDFFNSVAGQIIKLLKGKAFLPTLGSDNDIVYKLPSQIAVCQDPVIRDVIGRDELERHLSLSYLHPALSPAPPASLLSHLGVRYLRGSDVTTVTTAMAKELVKVEGIHSDGGLRQLARLLVCNFRALEYGYEEAEAILQRLKDLPIIPLADGRVVALSAEEAFFPMEETTNKKKKSAQTGPLAALYKDVSFVHPSLLSCVEPLESQQVRELLRRLGVHELEPQELLEQHIYPSIRTNKWKSKSEAVVVSYLVFIKQHSSSSQEFADIAVPVLTNRGLQCPGVDRVHFSEEYGNINLPDKLPGYDWTLLSPSYVQTDWDVAGWRGLFTQLGVREGFIIRKERQTLTAKELMSSPWSAESETWNLKPSEGCMLDDYPCEEFRALATAELDPTLLLQQRTDLLRLLATNWNSGHHYSQYLTAQVIDSDGRPIKSTNSSFFHFLCRLAWVPAHRQLEGDQCERKFLSPNSVFLTSPEVNGLLGNHVHYVDIDASEFTRDLGMRHCVSVDSLIDYLKQWCVKAEAGDQEQRQQQQPEDESAGANFTTTVQHIHNVYTYLSTNCPPNRLKELFQLIPAVFIEYNRRAEGWCSGRFYHLKEVCWSDTTTMFHRYKQLTREPGSPVQEPKLLAPFYRQLDGMSDFFKLLKVDRNPNMNQYVGLLELICSSSPIPTSETLQDVSVLYATLAHKCKVLVSAEQDSSSNYSLNTGYCSTLKGMVSDKRVFPTKDNCWVSLAHKPMIADSKELEKVFKPHKQVCLLNLPPAEKKAGLGSKTGNSGHPVPAERANVPNFNETDRSLFMEICGIHSLSQCVKTEPQTENWRPCPAMQALVRSIIPYIQQFLYHHEDLADIYSDLVANNIGEKIKCLQFGQVGKLYIRYELNVADSDMALEMQNVICVLKDEKELYIQKDHLDARLEICRELVKLFCAERGHRKELMHFLGDLITSLNDAKALKRLLQKEDIRDLPSDEEQWEVPKPLTPEVPLERVPSRILPSGSSPEEPVGPAHQDGDALVCWPPRSSTPNPGGFRAVPTGKAEGGAVDAVLKKWPPPPGPKDKEAAPREGGHVVPQSPSGCEGKQLLRSISSISISSSSSSSSSRPPDQPNLQRSPSQPGQPHPAASGTNTTPQPVTEHSQQTKTSESVRAEKTEGNLTAPEPEQSPPSAPPAETINNHAAPHSLFVPEAVLRPGAFQGTADSHRPPLNLDVPLWIRDQPQQAKLEDMTLTCQRPSTVVMSEEQLDMVAIGEWGEQLVNSFLCHWRDSGEVGRPTHVMWCNRAGESGLPYDFKLTFGGSVEVFVEVKSTVKTERAFIHLSANELDFALREKERYHVYRVYNAGDAANVRLCRIKNLAQHLYTKELTLYLFV